MVKRDDKNKYVQAFITNISFPTSIDELFNFSYCFNMEDILGVMPDDDNNLCLNYGWTCPRWSKKDDIVFFYHAKTAISKINRLQKELLEDKADIEENDYWFMLNGLNRAKAIWREYGGKIFAVGRVCDSPKNIKRAKDRKLHWGSDVHAPIDSIFVLENPIDISEFDDSVTISRQSAITPVLGSNFDYLKKLIIKKNNMVRSFLTESEAQPIPLSEITKENWLSVTKAYRRKFFLEEQFRVFYVDYLLPLIGDKKTIFKECNCFRDGESLSRVDNVIYFNGKYLPVEVKLNVKLEKDLNKQLKQYLNADIIQLDKEKKVYHSDLLPFILVIDTEKIYLYDGNKKTAIMELDDIYELSFIADVKEKLKAKIKN